MSRAIKRLQYKKKLLKLEIEDAQRQAKYWRFKKEELKEKFLSMNQTSVLEAIVQECLEAQRKRCANVYKMQHMDTVGTRGVYDDILKAHIKNEVAYILGLINPTDEYYKELKNLF